MEEATGAPSSSAVYDPRRLRASGRDGGGVLNRLPSPLTMLLSRHTRRREFIAGLGTAVAWPFAAPAQQAERIRRIGLLFPVPGGPFYQTGAATLGQELAQFGWIEGRNLRIDI